MVLIFLELVLMLLQDAFISNPFWEGKNGVCIFMEIKNIPGLGKFPPGMRNLVHPKGHIPS